MLVTAVLTLHLLALPSRAAPDPLTPHERQWLAEHDGKIRLAPVPGYPPVDFVNDNGEYSGLSQEYIRRIEVLLGFQFRFVQSNSFPDVIEKLRSREADLTSSLIPMPERASFLTFQAPHVRVRKVIIMRSDGPATTTLKELAGKLVAMTDGYQTNQIIRDKYPEIQAVPMHNEAETLMALSLGHADAAVMDMGSASYHISRMKITNLKVAGDTGLGFDLAIASRNDWPELASILTKGLALIPPEERRAMEDHWFHLAPLPFYQTQDFWRTFLKFCTAALLIVMGAWVWRGALRVQVRNRTKELDSELHKRLQVEAALRESEERHRLLVESAGDAIYLADISGRLVDVNPEAERQTGHTRAELLTMSVADLDKNHSLDSFRGFAAVMATQRTATFETRHTRKDGGSLPVELHVVYLESTGQAYLLGLARDISEYKRMETQLRASNEMLQTVLDTIPQSICWKDRNSVLLGCNANYASMAGLQDPQAVGGMTDWDLPWRHEESAHFLACDQRVMDANTAEYHIREQIFDASGQQRWLDTSKVPLHDADGRVNGVLVAFEDVTLRILGEEQLIEMKDRAETACRAKSEFLANMSHEIRTPLNGVLGMLQLLETTVLDEEQKEYLVAGIKSSTRLSRLLSDILDLSRIEADKLALHDVRFEMNSLRESMLEMFAQPTREKGLTLECVFDEQLPQRLLGDEARLRQILFNLVGNAVKFTDTGHIRLEATVLASNAKTSTLRLLFIVSDTGVGIADCRLDDIFDPFVQVEGSYVRSHQGAGLGLSIVRRLVHLMGGSLSIENSDGAGTAIYVSLPFKLPADEALEQVGTPLESGSLPLPLRVLYAEDDAVSVRVGARMLEKAGCTVSVARDGQSVLVQLAENDFDLILMDVQMPVMDGVEAARSIRAASRLGHKARIPIIAMTAYAMTGDKEKFLEAGMNGYVSKPVSKDELLQTIEQVMAGQDA